MLIMNWDLNWVMSWHTRPLCYQTRLLWPITNVTSFAKNKGFIHEVVKGGDKRVSQICLL